MKHISRLTELLGKRDNFHIWGSELEMVDAIETLIQDRHFSSAYDIALYREFDTGVGIADILCAIFDAGVFLIRSRDFYGEPLPKLTRNAAYVLVNFPESVCKDLSSIAALSRMSNLDIALATDILLKRRLVKTTSRGMQKRKQNEIFALQALETYEAKLKNWHRTLMQAIDHTWFCSGSYIIQGYQTRNAVSNATDGCRNHNIGLLLALSHSWLMPIVSPRPRPLQQTYLAWIINEQLLDDFLCQ
jgi:hypothetical protein